MRRMCKEREGKVFIEVEELDEGWTPDPSVLLHPTIPKPMHGMAPRLLLGREWWDVVRQGAYASTNYHCLACGVHKTNALEHQWLEGHEVYKIDYYAGRMIYLRTIPLCHYCHSYIHIGRLTALLERKMVTKFKVDAVTRRGNKLLRKAKLKPLAPYTGLMAQWHNWRMVINGIEYPPVIRDEDEWELKYSKGVIEE